MADATGAPEGSTRRAGSFGELASGLRQTFRSGHTTDPDWRRSQLTAMLAMVEENEAEFMRALDEDLGRSSMEAYLADLGHLGVEVGYLRKHLERWTRPTKVNVGLTSMPARGRIVPQPLGVALVIAPWNYPIQLLLEPMAAAIAAGNCVVGKPSELAPACSAVLARLVPRYLDDTAIALVEGGVPETTALLELRWDKIFYTGSTDVGRIVMRAAAEHLTPVTLELGGKSPTVVTADADLEVAAKRIAWGKFLNAGQTCVAPDYVLADSRIRGALVDKLADTIAAFYGDDPQRSPSYGRIVNERHRQRLSGLLEDHGGSIAIGGRTDPTDRYVEPTIVVDPDPGSPLMQQEIFGPILPVITVDGTDHAIDWINDRPKPLALYVFGSPATAETVLARTTSGGACVNHCVVHLVPSSLPFGGVGDSGMGAYHGKAGFDVFSHHRSVMTKPTRPDPPIIYPPYTRTAEKLVRRLL